MGGRSFRAGSSDAASHDSDYLDQQNWEMKNRSKMNNSNDGRKMNPNVGWMQQGVCILLPGFYPLRCLRWALTSFISPQVQSPPIASLISLNFLSGMSISFFSISLCFLAGMIFSIETSPSSTKCARCPSMVESVKPRSSEICWRFFPWLKSSRLICFVGTLGGSI